MKTKLLTKFTKTDKLCQTMPTAVRRFKPQQIKNDRSDKKMDNNLKNKTNVQPNNDFANSR